MGGLLVFILEIFHGIRHPLSRAGSCCKTIFVVSTRLHIAALTTRFRELDGEAKSVVKSLLPIMVEIACVSTGVADGVNPLPTHFIRTMAVVPPDA